MTFGDSNIFRDNPADCLNQDSPDWRIFGVHALRGRSIVRFCPRRFSQICIKIAGRIVEHEIFREIMMTTEGAREGFEIYDERFGAMLPDDARLVRHHTGMDWAEGPVYFADGDYVLWSDIPNDVILRYSDAEGVSVFRHPCGYTNGHYRDARGRLISCEHGGRRVSRTEPDGTVVTLADSYEG